MGDLVIKPESGGSIKIQNSGGTDTLVSDNSGNVTLAGTANNLGTVTAGSIAGGTITSATTFPAGHIINTITTSPYTTSGATSTNTSDWQATGLTISVTAGQWSGGSKIVVYAQAGYAHNGTQMRYRIYRTAPGSEQILTGYYHTLGSGSAQSWNRNSFTMIGVDTSLGSGTHTYIVRFIPLDGTVYYMGASSDDLFNIIAYVIK